MSACFEITSLCYTLYMEWSKHSDNYLNENCFQRILHEFKVCRAFFISDSIEDLKVIVEFFNQLPGCTRYCGDKIKN